MRGVRLVDVRRAACLAGLALLGVLLMVGGCSKLAGVQALMTVSRSEGPAPLSVQFDLSESSAGSGAGSYYLEFGDDTPMVQGTDFAMIIPHVYQSPGTFIAELTVVGDEGEINQQQISITALEGLPEEGSAVRDLAIAFTATSTDGQEIVLSELRGQVVLIEFWGSWCTPCRQSMPHINELWEEFHEQGLVVLAVSTDASASESVQYLEANGFDGLICLWEAGKKQTRIKVMYNVEWIPRSIVIDKQGIIRYNGHPMELEASFIATLIGE
jgi:peroxiredoxin